MRTKFWSINLKGIGHLRDVCSGMNNIKMYHKRICCDDVNWTVLVQVRYR